MQRGKLTIVISVREKVIVESWRRRGSKEKILSRRKSINGSLEECNCGLWARPWMSVFSAKLASPTVDLLVHCPSPYHSKSSMKVEVLSFCSSLYPAYCRYSKVYLKESRLLLRGRIIIDFNYIYKKNASQRDCHLII